MASTNGVFSGKVILPLLALGGVVSWIRWKIRQVHAAKEDYLSQLPDAVLSTILGHLTVKDATRTSILSRRWRYLFTSMPKLRFRCLQMFGVLNHDHHSSPYYQKKFVKGVNQLLELYSGRTVAHIEMYFCFWKEFSNEFEQWMHSISRLGVENLYLYFGCDGAIFPTQDFSKFPIFPLELLSQASSLKRLQLYHCFVQPSSIVRFNSLMILNLMGVLLASGHLEDILSSCVNLELLCLEACQLPYKLRLASTVTSVVFLSCYGVEQIDLQAANLRRLDCHICNEVRFFFSYVPMLEYVSVHPWGPASMSYTFGDFARDLPAQVKYLAVKVDQFEVNCFPTEMKMFKNLRELGLALVNMSDFFDIVKLLCACPLLQYLTLLTITKAGQIRDERSKRPYLAPTCHTVLKEVRFGGFHGTESEIEFALCILRSAIVLEKMILSPFYRCLFGYAWKDNLDESYGESELNSIQQKLFGQAISCKAEVIIY